MSDTYQASVVMALREAGGVGPKMFQALLAMFGSPENVFGANSDELAELRRVSEERAEKILAAQEVIPMMHERIERIREENIFVVTYLEDDYPARLRKMDDPPPILYYRGTLPKHDQKAVCVIGTTSASSECIGATVELAGFLCKHGYEVVSGLARGIDGAAHLGAIASGGRTHAVMGAGFYHIYPEENKTLAGQIVDSGSIMTEFPPDTEVNQGRLLSRNRIVVGLSDAAIITELSSDGSGCQSAADACDDQGKLLFYVLKGNEAERGIKVPSNAIPFEALEDIENILERVTENE